MVLHNAFEAAAAVAFWFFLSMVPLLVLVGYVVGQVARSRGVDALAGPFLEVVPLAAEDLVRKAVERLAGAGASGLAPLGVAGYLWTSSSGLHNLMDVCEKAANASDRPWWKQRALALAWIVVGILLASLLAIQLATIDSAFHEHARHVSTHGALLPRRHPVHDVAAPAEQAIAAMLTLVLGTALLGGFYRFAVEHPANVRRSVWPGTLTAVVSWLVVSWAFGEYAISIADYAVYYGSLAAVAVLLVWLYLTSVSLVLGAEINAMVEQDRAQGGDRRRPRPARARG